MNNKIVFIGCGVSTIFSVIKLLERGYEGKNIIIVEKGKDIYNRNPKEVMNGFGGAGGYSDGKIIYSLEQGGDLISYTGRTKGKKLISETRKIIRMFHPDVKKIKIENPVKEPEFIKNSPFTLKQSSLDHIGTNYLFKMNQNIQKYFKQHNVNMLFNCDVFDVNFDRKEIYYIKDANTNPMEILKYDKLVFATGKSGVELTNKMIRKYKLITSPKAAQIGVRFESKMEYFKPIIDVQYDFKLSVDYGENINVRTFCVNSHSSYVTKEKTYGYESYNGHAYQNDKTKKNSLTNFGIMLEIKDIEDPFKFTKELVERTNNEIEFGGKVFSPSSGLSFNPTAKGVKISVADIECLYGENAYIIEDFISKLNSLFNFGEDYCIYLPEIKYLSRQIKVNKKDLSLEKHPEVHFIGDCLSARGIFVSAAQGIYLAESIDER